MKEPNTLVSVHQKNTPSVFTYMAYMSTILLYCGRVPAANARGCTTAEGLLYKPETLVVKGGTTWARNGR